MRTIDDIMEDKIVELQNKYLQSEKKDEKLILAKMAQTMEIYKEILKETM